MTETMDRGEKLQQFDRDVENIIELLDEKAYFKARDAILKYNEVDIGEILEEVLEELGVEKTIIIFRMLPKDVSVEVFSYLPADDQVAIVQGITDREISYIIKELDFDDKIDVLEELPANIVDKILEKTPKEERKLINTFLNYPDTCAGSLMTPDYISLQENMTVAEAMAHIKNEGMDSETVYTCYVKKGGRKLDGIVSLRSLVIADDDSKIADLMNTDYVYVNVYDDQEEVAETFKKYGFLAVPVVDKEHRLVGIITVDDILDVIEEETTEDIERMAGVMDDTDSEYLDKGVFRHVRNRLPWLLFMTVSLMITGSIISSFESVLSQVIVLVSYMPLLMGTGGNTGTQAATLVIRGLALDDIDLKDGFKVFWKELRISIIIGVILSAVNLLKVIFVDGESLLIGLTVAVSMIVIIMFAKLVGGLLPMAAKKIGIDPALMATPMISSLTDMVSAVTFLLIASAFLGIAL
ncbi:MAG TPA: magnesium transporter [Candidatus Copromorpha excrementigallinarum]|uniref:Magnesium transporter MgtE n=1 Tax=Candidatus Allocopromorpha excrementigallinarum TaxID=2840742 RepID=A0A9D1L717_9FIRM|nr:magnesium transporter [Candidatus Copromorpha excrementigallinarum]